MRSVKEPDKPSRFRRLSKFGKLATGVVGSTFVAGARTVTRGREAAVAELHKRTVFDEEAADRFRALIQCLLATFDEVLEARCKPPFKFGPVCGFTANEIWAT